MTVTGWLCTGEEFRELDRAPGDLPGALAELDEPAYLWIVLDDPSAEELQSVAGPLGLPGHAVRAAGQAHQRPRVDAYGELQVWVLKTLWYLDPTAQIETGDIAILLKRGLLVTVRHGRRDPVQPAHERLAADALLLGRGPQVVAYTLIDVLVDDYLTAAGEVARDVTALEGEIFAGPRVDAVERLYSFKREILEFRNAIEPLEPVAEEVLEERRPGPAEAYLRDVSHHVKKVSQSVRGSEDLINSLLSAHLGQISMWQNEDMRRISGWAAIIAAPTMIAGIYGMNFDVMPELHWSLGYPLVLLVMAACCWLLYRAFRRNGWL